MFKVFGRNMFGRKKTEQRIEELIEELSGTDPKAATGGDEDPGKETGEVNILKEIGGWILYIAAALLICYLILHYVGQRTVVSGSSMETTLSDGDNLIVEKITYRFHDPKRFDIIVFPYRYDVTKHYIKRIIGLPGETVQIIDDTIYINGEVLEENYGTEPMAEAGVAASPILLGDDEYFVLGDNRNHSSDSRAADVGFIHRSDITGRAWMRIFPFNKIRILEHQ